MAFVRPVQHGTWQLLTPTPPHGTALMPLSLRDDFLSVNCGREQLVPAEGHAVLHGSPVCALAQAHGLQWRPSLNVVRERASDLRHKSPPILGSRQGPRGENGCRRFEIRAGQLRKRERGLPRLDCLVADDLSGVAALLSGPP